MPAYKSNRILLTILVAAAGLTVTLGAAATRYISDAKYKTKVIPYLPVRMRDGVELAVRITRPDADGKFPTILSYNPYHSLSRSLFPSGYEYVGASIGASGATVLGDPRQYPEYFAERGYVMVDFDVRGTGDSGGYSPDQYAKDELRDGYDMVEWSAAQPWSNGNVGMWGISYGGVDTFQIAAAAPPHLKAVIVRSGTDDVYTDWVYPGGVPRSLYIFGSYGPNIIAQNFAPPDVELVGTKWPGFGKNTCSAMCHGPLAGYRTSSMVRIGATALCVRTITASTAPYL